MLEPYTDIDDIASQPRRWREVFGQAVASGDLAPLRRALERRILSANPYILVRLSVILRREGRYAEAEGLLRGQDAAIARAQLVLNALEIAPSGGRRTLSAQLEAVLGPAPIITSVPDIELEGRARWEVARAMLDKYQGRTEEARAGFIRAQLLAELYGDTQFRERAKAELAALGGETEQDHIARLRANLEQALATNDPVFRNGAAMMLAHAAWEDDLYPELQYALSHLPQGHPEREAYEVFIRLTQGIEPQGTPQHPVEVLAHTFWLTAQALRARDRMEPARARQIARQAIEGSVSFFSPAGEGRRFLMLARAHDVLGDYSASAALLAQASKLFPESAPVARALVHAYAIESHILRPTLADDDLRFHLGALLGYAGRLDPGFAALLGGGMLVYAPHALSAIAKRLANPVMIQLISGDRKIVVTRKEDINQILQGTRPTDTQLRVHLNKVVTEEGRNRSVLLQPRMRRLQDLLSEVPESGS